MRPFLLILFALLVFTGGAQAADFPALTGRVVDNGHLLSPAAQEQLTEELAAFEQKTSDQVVVVTLPDLGGQEIEEYGYQLGRAWGIGEKARNNGLLLIVAVKEHRVRIEVGYGLEGVMTDAISSAIIQGVILPDFRKGAYERGVMDGTQAIMGVLSGDENAVPKPATTSKAAMAQPLVAIFAILFWIFFAMRHPFLAALFGSGMFRGGGSGFGGWGDGGSGGGFGGGFSGGGGSFGGGGASGSW